MIAVYAVYIERYVLEHIENCISYALFLASQILEENQR